MSVLLSMFRLERVLSHGAVRFSRILGSVGFPVLVRIPRVL